MAWWTVPNAGLAISKKHFALLFCLNWETVVAFHCLLALLQYWCCSIMCLFFSSWKRVRAARCNLLTKSVSYAIWVRLGLRIRKEHVPRRCDGVWWNRMVEPGRCGREMGTCGLAAMSPGATSRAETAKPFLIFVFSKSWRLNHHLLILFLTNISSCRFLARTVKKLVSFYVVSKGNFPDWLSDSFWWKFVTWKCK